MDRNLRGVYEGTSQFNYEDEIPSIFQQPNVNLLNRNDTMVGWNQHNSQNLGGEGLSNLIASGGVCETLVDQNRAMGNLDNEALVKLVNEDDLRDKMLKWINQMLMEDESEGVCETLVDKSQVMGNLNNEAPLPQYDERLNVVSLSNERYDLRDQTLKCINQMLMEDDMEEKPYTFQQSAALKASERSFYELIGEEYPPSPNLHRVPDLDQNENYGDNTSYGSGGNHNRDLLCPNWDPNPGMCQTTSERVPINVGVEKNHGNHHLLEASRGKASRGKKHTLREDTDLPDGRTNKQSAIFVEPTVTQEVFDKVLLEDESTLCRGLQSVSCESATDNDDSKVSDRKKSCGKKRGTKRADVVDLRTLLTLCAQAVAIEDIKTTNDYLKTIRQHSSRTGDDMQRLAHYFADALESRITGTRTRIYKALKKYPRYPDKALKAYQIYLNSCPFRKISNMFSNKTVTNLAQNASSVHIIDFGIGNLFGFQWPCLIQRLSSRPGGPPKVRITGVDFPQQGFRPAERVEGTGRILTYYAKKFSVPFEFNSIAKNWETITAEDLKIIGGEVLIVNCLYRLRYLLDDTVIINSLNPRDSVLKLIHRLRPDVFIHGILNSACNAPFFTSRFRAALNHYSAVFDMLEATIPRDVDERAAIEGYFFGQQAMNVIACEESERVERPETYKQWQVRNTRAGFVQLPLNREIVKMSRHMLKAYHKEFVIDEDGQWLLLGWKGRAIFALSSWKPA